MSSPEIETEAAAQMPAAAAASGPGRRAFLRVALLLVGVNTILILTSAFTTEKLSFLYKDTLKLDPGEFATLGILLLLPSYLRPLMGSLADLHPLFGYHRRSYFVLAALLHVGGFFVLSGLPHYTYGPVAAFVLLALLGVYLRLVVVEAVAVRVGNATGQISRLQSIQWLVPSAASILFGAHLSGYVTQHWSYHACFRAAALSALLALPLVFLIDERRVGGRAAQSDTATARQNRLTAGREDKIYTREALRRGLRSPGMWTVIAFVFFLQLTPKTGAAQFFYMVDHLHFTKQFLGNLGAYTSSGEILGIVAFGFFSPRLPVRVIVWGIIACSIPLYAPLFWLRGPVSAEVTGFLTSAAGITLNLGVTTLAARACPPRIEATIFGLVLAASTLGGALSNKIGSALYTHFGAGGHLTAGWEALLWIGMGTALLSAAFFPFLPPWARSAEPLLAQTTADSKDMG